MPHLSQPITVVLEYSDADGIETRRKVDIYRTAKKQGYSLITGWCHGRQAERSFRSDRVQAVIDDQGEVFSAEEFLAGITGRRKVVDMSPAEDAPQTGEPRKLASTAQSRITWGTAIFIVALSPAVIIALGMLFAENDLGGAVASLVILGLPVIAVRSLARWVMRRMRD